MKIGEKVKEQRLKKKWTQEQLAQLLNVSRSTVSSWEVGRNYPDLETIISISKWNSEKGMHVFTQKDEFMIEISYDDVITTSISPENDSNIFDNYYLELNQDGTLSGIASGLSKEEKQTIHEYLERNKDVYVDLIEKTFEKKLELSR